MQGILCKQNLHSLSMGVFTRLKNVSLYPRECLLTVRILPFAKSLDSGAIVESRLTITPFILSPPYYARTRIYRPTVGSTLPALPARHTETIVTKSEGRACPLVNYVPFEISSSLSNCWLTTEGNGKKLGPSKLICNFQDFTFSYKNQQVKRNTDLMQGYIC